MSKRRLYVSLFPLTLALAACAAPPSADLDVQVPITQPIINGQPPNAAYHDAVVSLHQRQGSYVSSSIFCSGTLITPDVVLTAAHCLDTANGGPNYKTLSPASLAVYVGNDPTTDPSPSFFFASETQIHPSYDRRRIRNDIALVRLETPVPSTLAAPVAALPSSLGLTSADIGATLNFAGFGQDENGNYNVKLQADGTLGGFGCSVSGCSSSGDPATQISYNQYESGPCFGDSGGPAFLLRDAVAYVAGITSYGDSNCSVYGVSTRADAYESFIAAFVGSSSGGDSGGTDGGTDGGDSGGTDGGTGGTDTCGDGVCGAGESCDGRGGTTSCPSDCPGKTNGPPWGRYCYVEGVCQGDGC